MDQLVELFFTKYGEEINEEYLQLLFRSEQSCRSHVKVCGYLRRAGRFLVNSSRRFFCLNPVQGTFTRYVS